jgi:hypothetical protein
MQNVNVVFNTSGSGYWSDVAKAVTITDISLGMGMQDGDSIFGELQVYFDLATWNPDNDGLIYTDRQFLAELQAFLSAHGLPGEDVSYSEQGMQGDDYVSLDAGTAFYKAWMAKFNISADELVEPMY